MLGVGRGASQIMSTEISEAWRLEKWGCLAGHSPSCHTQFTDLQYLFPTRPWDRGNTLIDKKVRRMERLEPNSADWGPMMKRGC